MEKVKMTETNKKDLIKEEMTQEAQEILSNLGNEPKTKSNVIIDILSLVCYASLIGTGYGFLYLFQEYYNLVQFMLATGK